MGEFVPRFERELDSRTGPKQLPTAGAIPVKNEKGEVTMQKVKVVRYKAGQRPAYAAESSSASEHESESDDERHRDRHHHRERRHHERHRNDRHRERERDRRAVAEPELIRKGRRPVDESEDEEVTVADELGQQSDSDEEEKLRRMERARARGMQRREQDRDEEEDMDQEEPSAEVEEDIDERRARLKALRKQRDEEELLQRQQEGGEEVSDESEEDEDEEESEEEEDEEDDLPLLKPTFVSKRDRITLLESEKEAERLKALELEDQERKKESKLESIRLAQEAIKREEELAKAKTEDSYDLGSVLTDEENEEIEYESWKLREMKRIKRTRDEREALAKEQAELDKIHNMTEEERVRYLKANPRIITNQQDKGKYKLFQKYFHRGAFFLDQEDDILKRNFAEATLDDQFDKSVLPKVMQVKNFGKASRSKWTHLTAEDTTDHQGTWATASAQSTKFVMKSGGVKEVFDRPTNKKRRMD